MDLGYRLTEELLAELEKKVAAAYAKAEKEMSATIKEYFEKFRARDEAQKKLLDAGEINEEQYKLWRLNQMGRGERYKALQAKLADRIYRVNEVAAAYINDATPGIYSLNRNYAAYTIEQVHGNIGFDLLPEEAVRRLLVEEPQVMPNYPAARAVKRGIDLAYSNQQISAAVLSGIMQGKSVGKIATDLQERISTMNRASALRAARTATTAAQNGGRQDSFDRAAALGITVYKRWVAVKDNRTRHSHGVLDGQIVPYNKPFISVLGSKMMFPGDDKGGKPADVYNCRCGMKKLKEPGIEAEPRLMRVRDPKTGRNVLVNEMTFSEWEAWKKAEDPEAWEIYKKKGRNLSADKKQHERYVSALGKKVPSTLDEFQNLKYKRPQEWEKLKKLMREARDAN